MGLGNGKARLGKRKVTSGGRHVAEVSLMGGGVTCSHQGYRAVPGSNGLVGDNLKEVRGSGGIIRMRLMWA